jgi:tellurite methyltransferase
MTVSDYWAAYYQVTVERPAWRTVLKAIELFAAEPGAGGAAPGATPAPERRPFAVDLGCGAGRDTRALLRAGWRVLAVDREPVAAGVLTNATEPELRADLQTAVADLADFEIPPCDLVNASLCLPFLDPPAFAGTWSRIVGSLRPGARFAAMLFGDRDGSASDPEMTCLPPERVRADLVGFEIEHWVVEEDDRPTALGEPHHFHLVEFVARKLG